jgi:hypothetical protein
MRSATTNRHRLLLVAASVAMLTQVQAAIGQMSLEDEPINYHTTPVRDPVARLQERIDAGEIRLEFDDRHGYLPAVLDALHISPQSQTLVFSKTSFQRERISPSRPRALYFNDDIYVGWVQHGTVMELSAVDPRQGAIFYTLAQRLAERPTFIRDRGECLGCHASSRTWDVPGHLVRSVFTAPDGQPHFGAGTFRTTHSSPLQQRWGGWYVTGTHGSARHMGNVLATDDEHPEQLDCERGANVTNLASIVDTTPYLTKHSDIVALMVLEHQTDMHNRITRAGYDARRALRDGRIMNKLLELPEDHISESTRRRINNAAGRLLEYTLFVDEATLPDPIRGTSDFAAQFTARGKKDRHGRSLRDFDLRRRLFRYPCSYLVHSAAFNALPPPLLESLYRRLWEILHDQDAGDTYSHLSAEDRRAILEILQETKSGLPDDWKNRS